jgi:hypothetical protein
MSTKVRDVRLVLVRNAGEEALLDGSASIEAEHVLLALAKLPGSTASRLLWVRRAAASGQLAGPRGVRVGPDGELPCLRHVDGSVRDRALAVSSPQTEPWVDVGGLFQRLSVIIGWTWTAALAVRVRSRLSSPVAVG